jgi:hypothetical protein
MESLSSRQAAMCALINALQEFCVRQIKYDLPPLTVRNTPIVLMSHEWQCYYEVCLRPLLLLFRKHSFGLRLARFLSIPYSGRMNVLMHCAFYLSRQVCSLVVINLVTSECEGSDSFLGPGNGKHAQRVINNLVCYSLECFGFYRCGSTNQCGGNDFWFGVWGGGREVRVHVGNRFA